MPSQAKTTTSSPMRQLIQRSARYRQKAWYATIYSVLNKLFDTAPEILIGVAVDVVVKRENSFLASFGIGDVATQLWALGILTFFIWVFESLFEYLSSIQWRQLAQLVQHELRMDAYAHVQALPAAFFETQSVGQVTASINDDINQLERFLDGGANAIVQLITALTVIGAIFFYLSPYVAFIAILPTPIIIWGAFFYKRFAEERYARVRQKAASIAGIITNNLAGIMTIKSSGTERFEADKVRLASQSYLDVNKEAIHVSSAFKPLIRMAVLAGFLATLLVGGFQSLSGSISVGAYGVLVFLTQRMLWPLTGLADTADLYQRARASTTRVLELLALPTEDTDSGANLERMAIKGDLAFDKITFAYDGRSPLFKQLSLSIPAGHSVAIVGGTGSGKSTLAKLLLRFYTQNEGRILLDGVDIRHYSARSLRHQIGYVGQDMFLFQGTVAENIAYGNPGASRAAIEAAARAADAHSFINHLPLGYDTSIGESGLQLSGGQRQRLVIARAILRDPAILLLDEATSAVDNESEQLIQKAIGALSRGKTTLMIAHRLSTVRHCNKIYVMHQGTIIESGTHDELLKRAGQYAALWRVQTGEA